MIFITVGSRSFQFDRLLKAVDEAVAKNRIKDKIFAQVGNSRYPVKNYETVDFLNHRDFNKKLEACDIIITHGGTGIIVNSAKMGKRIIAVPRLAEYEEVVDNHQLQLVKAFEKQNIVIGCYDCSTIAEAINHAKEKEIVPFKSNTQVIIDSIDSYIHNI